MFQNLFGNRKQSAVATMNVQQLDAALNKHTPMILVDVRQPDEFADGHVAGARLLPLPQLMMRVKELPANTPIVCICRSGNRSGVACELLQRHGFSDVTNVAGGMLAWQRAGLPTVQP